MTTKTITVRVTADHIALGTSAPWNCPIALALNDAGIRSPWVKTQRWGIASHEPGEDPSAPLTRRAMQFVGRFDGGADVQPITLRLPLP